MSAHHVGHRTSHGTLEWDTCWVSMLKCCFPNLYGDSLLHTQTRGYEYSKALAEVLCVRLTPGLNGRARPCNYIRELSFISLAAA